MCVGKSSDAQAVGRVQLPFQKLAADLLNRYKKIYKKSIRKIDTKKFDKNKIRLNLIDTIGGIRYAYACHVVTSAIRLKHLSHI
jgi:hypothetical protein